MTSKLKAALLIDADNMPAAQAREALKELEGICNPIIRRAFGDFFGTAGNWTKDVLLDTGITPVQHFAVSNYKNGADIAMCIAAMDILHTRNVEALVLFSSDCDFGPLASRLRESGLQVIGIGDKKASDTFKACFDKFITVTAPVKPEPSPIKIKVAVKSVTPVKKATPKKPTQQRGLPKEIRRMVIDTLVGLQTDNDPILVSKVSVELKARSKNFTPKKYGFASISKLLNSMNEVVLSDGNKMVRKATSSDS